MREGARWYTGLPDCVRSPAKDRVIGAYGGRPCAAILPSSDASLVQPGDLFVV